MALYLNVSHTLEALSTKLSSNLKKENKDVFQPQYIVTQTEGMNNWLKMKIADHLGIAANCLFLKPSALIYKFYTSLDGKYPDTLSEESLTWLLYKIFGEDGFKNKYPYIAGYYSNDTFDKDVKRMALAEKTTDLFDQYQIYRAELIRKWNNTSLQDCDKNEWQQYLWIRAKQLSASNLPDKTNIGDHITKELKNEKELQKLKNKIPAVHIFGISIITKYHLDLLFQASAYIDITYYILNPAPKEYWFDNKSEKEIAVFKQRGYNIQYLGLGNSLLTGWGKVIQDTFRMFFERDELLNAYEDIDGAEPENGTLLHKIQHDIYRNATIEERNHISSKNIQDGSLVINSCYTIAREVEVLYNYLVHLVEKRKEKLSPREIVVMLTDIDAYSPYIKAIFNNAPYKFRYSIADESFVSGESMVSSLKSILEMNSQNFKAEQVMQLLDSGYIRRRFAITNIRLIRTVVDAANIKFGIEGSKEDDTRFISWLYGIKRIMYGICIKGEDEYNDGEEVLFPVEIVEGADTYELIKFCHFIQMLIDSIDARKIDRTIADWTKYIQTVVNNFVCQPEEDADEEYTLITEELASINIVSDLMNEKISYEIFNYRLLQSLSSQTRAGSFAGGGITFCSLIPMRSIPFKVVALLGINFNNFPRKETTLSFDLQKNERRLGDRNIKENDKNLFLETILSARKYLYISYIGQSVKDNTTIPPSAIVDELIDYIQSKSEVENVRDVMLFKQPLHNFSVKYNQGKQGLYNYLDNNTTSAINVLDPSKANKEIDLKEIKLKDFLAFFKNPIKNYYNKMLNIYYREDEVLLSETEIFSLDTLTGWSLKIDLLEETPDSLSPLINAKIRKGELPLKNMATIVVDNLEGDVAPVRELLTELKNGAEESKINIDVKVGDHRISGILENIYSDKLIVYSFSKYEFKYHLKAYLCYLLARAQGEEIELFFISATKQQVYKGTPINQKNAMERLEKLLEIYQQGHQKLIPFHTELNTTQLKKGVKAIADNDQFKCNDSYVMKEYANGFFEQEGVLEEFEKLAEELVLPVLALFPGYYS